MCLRRGALEMMIHRLIVFVCWRGRWRVGQIDCPSAHQHVKITDAPRGEGKSAEEAETRGKGEECESSRKVSLRLSERIHDRGCAKSRGCDAGVNLGGAGNLQQTADSGFQCHACREHATRTWRAALVQTQRRDGERSECCCGDEGPGGDLFSVPGFDGW
jgi:hypothetical protein